MQGFKLEFTVLGCRVYLSAEFNMHKEDSSEKKQRAEAIAQCFENMKNRPSRGASIKGHFRPVEVIQAETDASLARAKKVTDRLFGPNPK